MPNLLLLDNAPRWKEHLESTAVLRNKKTFHYLSKAHIDELTTTKKNVKR